MAFTLAIGSSNVYLVSSDGTVRTLTLPAGITIGSGRSRFATLQGVVAIVNGPSQPIWMDRFGTLRPLSLQKPVFPPTLTQGAAGAYTGTRRAKIQYLVKDDDGNIIAQSPLSDASAALTVAAHKITYGTLPLSLDPTVNARRIYVTADNGVAFFACLDVDDNTTTSVSDDTSDAAIALDAAPTNLLASPQRLDLVTEYRSRLVGRSPADIDTLYLSSAQQHYAWPTTIPIQPAGADPYGITGFMARRTELGICRRGIIWKLIGDGEDNFQLVKLVEGTGCVAPDSALVIRDVGYFLNNDGVYSWTNEGVKSTTDETVHPWFNTDDYFNRSQFPNAFAVMNPTKNSYVLFLCSAGSTTIDRWIELEPKSGRWLGPHKTAAFTPSAASQGQDANTNPVLTVGGTNGYIYFPQIGGTASDDASTAIEFDVLVNPHCGDPPNPDDVHFFGMPTVLTKYQASGALSIIPYVGDLTASAGATIAHDLTLERERLRILGVGRLLQMRFYKNTNALDIAGLYGYQFPWHDVGRR